MYLDGNTTGSNLTIGTNDNYSLNFETGNVTRMTILSSGEVGIGGSAAAGTALNVNGNIGASSIKIGGSINDANLPIQIFGSAAQYSVSRTSGTYGLLFGGYDTTTWSMRSVTSTDKISFIVNNTIQALNIFPSGGVSIGTLTDSGANNLRVAGTMTAAGLSITGDSAYGTSTTFTYTGASAATHRTALGLGTAQTPTFAGLSSTGDIEVTDFTRGVILRSPDSSRWRLTVTNTGALSTTKL